MTDIFVSYSRKDRETVRKLVDVMKGKGWSVWWDPTIRPGEYYEDVIEGALTTARCVIVVWSKNSVASKWVRAEAGEAANRGVLVPVVIDDAKIPFRFKQIQESQLSDWQFTPDHPELVRLLDSIGLQLSQAKDAPHSQAISGPLVVDEPPPGERPPTAPPKIDKAALEPPTSDFHTEDSTPRTADDIKDDLHPPPFHADRGDDLHASFGQETSREAPQPDERAKRPTSPPISVVDPPTVGASDTYEQARSPVMSKKIIVVAAIVVLVGMVVGAVYLFSARKSATETGDDRQAQATASPQPSSATTPPASQSPAASPTASPAASPVNTRKIVALLRGQWQSQASTATECQCAQNGCLEIQFGKTFDLCVESQIYVSASYQLDAANDKAYLFFKEPTDIGGGASRMPWDKFDRKSPLATIDLADLEKQRVIYVTWHGFTEPGDAKQRWRQLGGGYQGTYLKRSDAPVPLPK